MVKSCIRFAYCRYRVSSCVAGYKLFDYAVWFVNVPVDIVLNLYRKRTACFLLGVALKPRYHILEAIS